MSYILEALKKAQAERARGSIPDIGTQPLAPPSPDPAARRSPLLLGGAALAVIGAAGLLAWFAWSQHEPPAGVRLTGAAAQQAAAPAAPSTVSATRATAPGAAAPSAPHTAAEGSTAAATSPSSSPSLPQSAAAAAPQGARANRAAPPVAVAQPAPVAKPKPAPAAPAESVALLQDLPPQIQREIPTLAINGYIYASNPADRSVLINNHLRREGEQVAPGLTLEKLLPKEMVLNYRGYRYRIAY
jgi:general secretion pathway protein B